MRKKIIFFLLTLFLIAFSQPEDIIFTLPKRDKAYLDIEVTKITTENLEVSNIDLDNKTLTLNNFSLDASHSLLLGENSELFGSLFSVNGRLPALKDIARQTNLSYTQEENGQVVIHYKELPSTIYGGLWNKNKRTLEKIYQLNILRSSLYSKDMTIEFMTSSIISSEFFDNKDVIIKIGEIKTKGHGWGNTSLHFNENNKDQNIVLKSQNNDSLPATLYFRNRQNINNLSDNLYGNLSELNGSEIVALIAKEDFKNYMKSHSSYSFTIKEDKKIISKGHVSEEFSLKNINMEVPSFLEIISDYPQVNHKIFIKDYVQNEMYSLKVGSYTIKNLKKKWIKLSWTDNSNNHPFYTTNPTGWIGQGYFTYKTPSDVTISTDSDAQGDIIFNIPWESISHALNDNSPLHIKESKKAEFYVTWPSESNRIETYPKTLGPYILYFDESTLPLSNLTILGLENGQIIIDHGAINKGQNSYIVPSQPLTLTRKNSSHLLTNDIDNVTFSFENSGRTELNTPTSTSKIISNLSVSSKVLSFDNKSLEFSIQSSLETQSVNNAENGDYVGTNILNITINN